MLDQLNTQAFQALGQTISQDSQTDLAHLVLGLDQSARAIFIANLYQAHPRPTLIVEPSFVELGPLYDDLKALLPDVPIYLFELEESLALEFTFSSLEDKANRIQILNRLIEGENCLVLTSMVGLRKQLSPADEWRQALIALEVGQDIEDLKLEQLLVDYGYKRQAMVESPGDFSIRGGIVDYYPLDADYPIRLDFFDTELDSIRLFNPLTQESIESQQQAQIGPAEEILFSQADQLALKDRIEQRFRHSLTSLEDEDQRQTYQEGMHQQLERLAHGDGLIHAAAFLSLKTAQPASLLDYLSPQGQVLAVEYGKWSINQHHIVEENYFWIDQETKKGLLPTKLNFKHDAHRLMNDYRGRRTYLSTVQQGFNHLKFVGVHNFQYRSMNQFFNQVDLIQSELTHWLQEEQTVQVIVANEQASQKTADFFEKHEIRPVLIQGKQGPQKAAINILQGSLSQGFELPADQWVVLTEKDLFNTIRRRSRTSNQHLSNAERLKSYSELSEGDYVVHVNHGIGRYLGIETLELKGIHRDMLVIEFDGQSKIFVPIDQIQLVQKYIASEGITPKLTTLGGTSWAKTKQKVQSQVENIADELIALYAARDQEIGYAYGPDTPEQKIFEEAFPYVETPDQLRSTAEIKQDMEKPRPMDRLLVGDVGYGKTEVAMRAIFKAVMEGKQVAFLVPTTVLAQQHYFSLVERFADFPVNIGLLSRFVTAKQQKETLADLKAGRVDVVVGTHRVLSKDVKFLDLGLLVVDEEQRFGVRHKERLKQLKQEVDVLTLTATPIPRTLHMSMLGVRDLSVIETPPVNRFPVQTYVMERNEAVIKSAIDRELARGGQVFYLYNRVQTIHQRAAELAELLPEARIAVAHGRLSERELENILLDFIQGDYDVLVTTTIIETGVDIPNANTLFIENADRMGLSTLYQIRGRVGRTHRVAYAYLMYEPFKQLSEVSEHRLNAIREFTELGSGFRIAMRDLSIRGAGNLLGQQQSGFINSVGFDLYSQLLKEAVDAKRGLKNKRPAASSDQLELDLQINAYLPDTYIADERQKISLYKQIQHIQSETSYRDLQDEVIDRFGEFPDPVANLLDIGLLRHYGLVGGIDQIKRRGLALSVVFNERASQSFSGPKVFEALQAVTLKAKLKPQAKQLEVLFDCRGQADDQLLDALIKFSHACAQIIENTEVESEEDDATG